MLANWRPERHPALPDAPTLRGLGVNVEFAQWAGLFAPIGTPEQVVAALRKAFREKQNDAVFKQMFVTLQTPLAYLDAPASPTYGTLMRGSWPMWFSVSAKWSDATQWPPVPQAPDLARKCSEVLNNYPLRYGNSLCNVVGRMCE